MKNVFGYIRVSTVKQGTGVSLQEQRDAIIRYAEKHNLNITEWFEELETAAKQGRPLFNKMIKLVKAGKSSGLIIHKIDRSARNLKDWALLGDLIDAGIEIHFAHESLDMETRGGRLAADIQAVIASDYIRNLRDEAKKGLYGRLKQGIYPFGAPIGYLNNGGGKLKTIDPINGPLIRTAFSLYATNKFSIVRLVNKMKVLGLRNKNGKPISKTTLSQILNNSFYVGILKIKGKSFKGNHESLIPASTFFKVQNILKGKTNSKIQKHDFLFRKYIKCQNCKYSLVGEKQKGNNYYRCHQINCPTKSIREEVIENHLIETLERIQLNTIESDLLNEILLDAQNNLEQTRKGIEESLKLRHANTLSKLERLTDAFIEGTISKEIYEQRKESLVIDSNGLKQQLSELNHDKTVIFSKAKKILELLKDLKNTYQLGIIEEKRNIMKCITSNFTINQKDLTITMNLPFNELVNRSNFSTGGHLRGTPRTENDNPETNLNYIKELQEHLKKLLDIILEHITNNQVEYEEHNLFPENSND